MNIKASALALLTGIGFAGMVAAQPAVVGDTVTSQPGSTGQTIGLDYLGTGSGVVGGQFMVTIDPTDVTVTGLTCGSAEFTCPAAANSFTILFSSGLALTEVQDLADAVVITYDVSGAATDPTDVSVAISNELYGDSGGGNVAPNGTMNGTIQIRDVPTALLGITPDPLTFGMPPVGGSAMADFTISNSGSADATSVSCSYSGDADISVDPFSGTIAQGANATATATCSPTADAVSNGTYTCTYNDGVSAGQMTSAALSCDGVPGAPVPAPSAGSTISATVGPVPAGASGSASATFSETAGTGGTYDVTCTITDNGGGAFTSTQDGMAFSVPSGGTANFVFTGQSAFSDPQPTGTASCVYSNGATGTVTVNLGIVLLPEIVPTLSQWGMIFMALVLGFFGFRAVRRQGVKA